MKQLVIIKRQFKLLNHQIIDNFPHETGGFFGGRDNIILGVFPINNKADRTKAKDTFSITEDDIYFAQKFFKDNRLSIMGMYHSHPNGLPAPSQKDMTHFVGDHFGRIHIIISIKPNNMLKKKFGGFNKDTAYQIRLGTYYCPSHKEKIPIELKIIENSKISQYLSLPDTTGDISQNLMIQEYLDLESKIAQMVAHGKINYDKEDTDGLSSSRFQIKT